MITSKQTTLPYFFAMWFIPVFYPAGKLYTTGVKVALIDFERNSPQIKMHRPDYKNAIAAALKQYDVYELLLVQNEKITEGSKSNVFFIREDTVFTAPDRLVLSGITRNKVIEICKKLSIPIHLQAIDIKSIKSMDAAFLTGTSPKVLPINEIHDLITFKSGNHIVQQILKEYEVLLEQNRLNFEY
jgi:branched-chain amino acid aminotransferase